MRFDDVVKVSFAIIAVFITLLFKPQIAHWWTRRQRIKEAERDSALNRELRKRDK